MITSNRDFNEWPLVFANPLMASATMDRLVHRAVKIVLDGKSCRSPRRTRNEAESVRSTGVSRYHLARRRGLTGRPGAIFLPAPGRSVPRSSHTGPYRHSWPSVTLSCRPSRLPSAANTGRRRRGHPAVPAVDGSRAALHVIHQAGYVADSYRDKRPEPHGLAGFSRGIDYGLLASSLFVLATFKFTGASLRLLGMDLSQHPFTTGGRQLLFPGVLRDEVFAWAALLAFVLCAAAYLIKCGYEVAQRRLNVPKTLHITLAASLFFITPALENLDVAFQGLNTWHSFQYKAHGMIGSATVARFAARGWGLYAVGVGLTAACGEFYLALRGLVLLIDA